jgi:hypothetical protein
LWLIGKRYHEEFILRIGAAAEFHDGLARTFNLLGHAATHVKNYAEGNWRVFTGKMLNLLLLLSFEELKVVLVEARDQPVHLVRDGDGHKHKINILLDRGRVRVQCRIDLIGSFVWSGKRVRHHMNFIGADLRQTDGKCCTQVKKQEPGEKSERP